MFTPSSIPDTSTSDDPIQVQAQTQLTILDPLRSLRQQVTPLNQTHITCVQNCANALNALLSATDRQGHPLMHGAGADALRTTFGKFNDAAYQLTGKDPTTLAGRLLLASQLSEHTADDLDSQIQTSIQRWQDRQQHPSPFIDPQDDNRRTASQLKGIVAQSLALYQAQMGSGPDQEPLPALPPLRDADDSFDIFTTQFGDQFPPEFSDLSMARNQTTYYDATGKAHVLPQPQPDEISTAAMWAGEPNGFVTNGDYNNGGVSLLRLSGLVNPDENDEVYAVGLQGLINLRTRFLDPLVEWMKDALQDQDNDAINLSRWGGVLSGASGLPSMLTGLNKLKAIKGGLIFTSTSGGAIGDLMNLASILQLQGAHIVQFRTKEDIDRWYNNWLYNNYDPLFKYLKYHVPPKDWNKYVIRLTEYDAYEEKTRATAVTVCEENPVTHKPQGCSLTNIVTTYTDYNSLAGASFKMSLYYVPSGEGKG
uniref:Uncharacterized protein n=1 Tax=Thermogemmatispora argillosa TaxID=2045280 RepID=A0A455T206_9CHLR|nr:hypothetical protein KTA_15880 [Thermogemmatispora argillosa]